MGLSWNDEGREMHIVMHPVHFETIETQMTDYQHSFLPLVEVPGHREPALHGHTW